jgi:hypothetical protein
MNKRCGGVHFRSPIWLSSPGEVDIMALLQGGCADRADDWTQWVLEQELGRSAEWVHGLSKSEAEDLLDWLENQGATGQVQDEGNESFALHCPGFQAFRDTNGRLAVHRRGESD